MQRRSTLFLLLLFAGGCGKVVDDPIGPIEWEHPAGPPVANVPHSVLPADPPPKPRPETGTSDAKEPLRPDVPLDAATAEDASDAGDASADEASVPDAGIDATPDAAVGDASVGSDADAPTSS